MNLTNPINILIVDDEPLVREGLKAILYKFKEKYSIDQICDASDGKTAIDQMQTESFSIVFSDIVMPNMDGIEFLSWISVNRPDCHRVVLSCHDDYSYVRDSFKHRVADYILKYDINNNLVDELLEKVTEKIRVEQASTDKKQAVPPAGYSHLKSILNPANQLRLAYIRFDGREIAERFIEEQIIQTTQNMKNSDSTVNTHIIEKDSVSLLILFETSVPLNTDLFNCIYSEVKKNRSDGETSVSVIYGENFKNHISITSELLRIEQIKHLAFIFGDGIYQQSDYSDIGISEGASDIIKLKHSIYREISEKHFTNIGNLSLQLNMVFERIKISITEIKKIYIEFIDLVILLYRDALNDLSDSELENIRKIIINAPFMHILKKTFSNIIEKMSLAEIFLIDGDKVSIGIKQALIYIYSNYHNNGLSLAEVSRKLNYSASYLSRQFKKELGENIVSYINNLRLREAQDLLKTGEYLIYEVSDIVGFNNYNYFSRLYKQKFGKSPKEDI